MKLSQWAKKNGLCYKTAWLLFKKGNLPCKTTQLPTGTIIVHEEEKIVGDDGVVIYGRVSSNDQKQDLIRQMDRLRDFCSCRGYKIKPERKRSQNGTT